MIKDLGCHKTRRLLALLPGNDLPPELDQPVRDHLAGCRACQRRLGDQLRVRSALGRLGSAVDHPHVDATFFAAMKRQILRRVHGEVLRGRAVPASFGRLVLARWMTAAAILLLVIYLLPQLLPDTTPDLPEPGPTSANVIRDRPSRDGGYLPPVGLHGQDEVLRRVLVLDGMTLRWIQPQPQLESNPTRRKGSR